MTQLLAQGTDGHLEVVATWPSFRSREFFLVPGSEYATLRVDVPPVGGDRLDAALPWRLRALYPGSTESTVLDHRPVPGDPKRRLVFAVDRDRLAVLRTTAKSRPLAAVSLLFASTPRQGPWVGVLKTSGWAEVIHLDGKSVLDSRPLRTGYGGQSEGEEILCALRSVLTNLSDGAPISVALAQSTDSGREALESELRSGFPNHPVVVAQLEKMIPRPSEESCSIFWGEKTHLLANAKTFAQVFMILALLLAASVPFRLACIREDELVEVKTEYEAAKERSREIMSLVAEHELLETRLRELQAANRPDAYRVLLDIADGAGSGVRARSLVLEGLSFRMEAEGNDGLTVLGHMRDSGLFDSLELLQSVVDPRGGERYTIQGSVIR